MLILQAAADGDLAKLKICLAKGELPSRQDSEHERTVLSWAVKSRRVEVVRYLLSLNTDLNVDRKDKDGFSAQDYAIQSGQLTVVRMLNEYVDHRRFPVRESADIPKAVCAWRHVRTQMVAVGGQTSETLHVVVRHLSKDGRHIKWQMPVGELHHQLRVDVSAFNNVEGNIIAVDMTFEIKIGDGERQHITFPLKVPGKKVFSISDAGDFGSACQILKGLFASGQALRPQNAKHGVNVDYDHLEEKSTHKQFVHHSEQALAAYLATPQAVDMIVTRLRTEMRGRNLGDHDMRVKVDAVIIDLHSNKTSCGPCEAVLVGMQRSKIGFVEQLQASLLADQAVYQFYLPKLGLRCKTIYSADSNDPTHKREYTRQETKWDDREPTVVDVRGQHNADKLEIALFGGAGLFHAGHSSSNVSARTIFTSASDINPSLRRKRAKQKVVSDEEVEDMTSSFKMFGF